jgi:hypothetical protein
VTSRAIVQYAVGGIVAGLAWHLFSRYVLKVN